MEVCQRLYDNNLINYNSYLYCLGDNKNDVLVANNNDSHNYGVSSDVNLSHIVNKPLIINTYYNENNVNYLAVKDMSSTNEPDYKITVTNLIYDNNENKFLILDIEGANYVVQHIFTGKYLYFNIEKKTIELTNNITKKNNILITTLFTESTIKYKFEKDGHYMILNNGRVKLDKNDTNNMVNINIIDTAKFDEVDEILVNYNTLLKKYNESLTNLYYINGYIEILENLKTHLINTINNAYDIFNLLQKDNLINITLVDLNEYKSEALEMINNNEISKLNDKVNELKNYKNIIENDIEQHKSDLDIMLNNLNISKENIDKESLSIDNEIYTYNNVFESSNINLDVEKFKKYTTENKKELLISEINNNIYNNKKTQKKQSNILFIIVISILIIVIIIQLITLII